MDTRNLFHKISYLQYPLMLIALGYALVPFFKGFESILDSYNFALIFIGLGISFSTLQDTKKTQNTVSRKIWENPSKAKPFITLFSLATLILIAIGITGLFSSDDKVLSDLSLGIIVMGIGMIGMLKSMLEMFENHRKDRVKQPQ